MSLHARPRVNSTVSSIVKGPFNAEVIIRSIRLRQSRTFSAKLIVTEYAEYRPSEIAKLTQFAKTSFQNVTHCQRLIASFEHDTHIDEDEDLGRLSYLRYSALKFLSELKDAVQ